MDQAPPCSAYSGQYLLSGDIPRFIDGIIQAVADVRTLATTLRQAGYAATFVLGISLGGNIAAQTLTMGEVDGGVLIIPAVDLSRTVLEAPIVAGIRRSARQAGFDDAQVSAALRVLDPIALGPPVVDPENMYVIYGQWDRQAPAAAVETLLEEWQGVSAVRYPAGHRTMGLRILALRHQIAGWFDAKVPSMTEPVSD